MKPAANLLLEGLHYVGHCRRLRDAGFEQEWHQMMLEKHPVSFDEFLSVVTPEEFERDTDYNPYELAAQDHTFGAYVSVWGDQPCVFFQSSGFEWIWLLPNSIGESLTQPPVKPPYTDLLTRRTMSPEDMAADKQKEADYMAAFEAWLDSIPENQAIIFKDEWEYRPDWKGVMYKAVTRDPSGQWRTTSFDPVLEMPSGHEVFKTRLEAAQSVATWERIPRLPFTVKAGEFHQQRTPVLIYRPKGGTEEKVRFGGYMAGGVTAQVMGDDGEWKTVSADDLVLP